MKRILVLTVVVCFLLPCLFLSACGKAPSGGTTADANTFHPEEEPDTPKPGEPGLAFHEPYDPATDIDNRFASLRSGIAETEDVIYWAPNDGNFLIYYDKASDEFAPLCGKPECEHFLNENMWEPVKSCNAYINAENGALWYMGGKLYYAAYENDPAHNAFSALYRMDPDGTNKVKLMPISVPENCALQNYQLHRGRLYSYCYFKEVNDAEINCTLRIYSTPIDKGECDYTLVYERTTYFLSWCRMRFVGPYMYAFVCYHDDELNEDCADIYRWNADTGEGESLYDGPGLGGGDAFWVDENGEVYSQAYIDGDSSKLARIVNGELETVMDFSDPTGDFYVSRIGNGVVIALRNDTETSWPADPEHYDIWLRDFEGETLYKGKLPMAWMEQIRKGGTFWGIDALTGDGNAIIAEYSVRWRNATHQNEPKGGCLVRYEITENGLVETLLGTYYEKIVNNGLL